MKPRLPIWLQGMVVALLISLCITFLLKTGYGQAPLPPGQPAPAAILLTPTPSHTRTPTAIAPTGPDLTITQIGGSVSGAPSCSTGPYNLFYTAEITIANNGSQDAGAFTIMMNGLSKTILNGLAAGATTTVIFTSTDGFYGGGVYATVDSTNQVPESNEANNTQMGGIPIPSPVPTCTPGTPTPTATATPTWSGGCTAISAADVAAPDCTTTPTSTATPPGSHFNVIVGVTPAKSSLQLGETIRVLVTIDNRSVGCQYPVYDLTLSQQGATIFRFDSPAKVGPPVYAQTVYTLTAISAGATTLRASAYGERNCGAGWQWTYVDGVSGALTVAAGGTPTFTPTATPTNYGGCPLLNAAGAAVPACTTTPTFTPTPTTTFTPTPNRTLLFADSFESGNFNSWSAQVTNGGDLQVHAAAALTGNWGLRAVIDDQNIIYLADDRPNAERTYQAAFWFDPNTITMRNGDAHVIFYGYTGAATQVLRLELRSTSGQYQLRPALRNDGSTWKTAAWQSITDASHRLELEWWAATAGGANNGRLRFRIDGLPHVTVSGVDNDSRRIDRVRLGAVIGIDSNTRGAYFFDAFEAYRSLPAVAGLGDDESEAFLEEVSAEEITAELTESNWLFLPIVSR